MAEYLSPGVYVEEYDSGSAPMQGVSTSTVGFVGLAERGSVVGAPVLVTSPADFNRKYGGYLQENEFGEYRYLAYAVNHFFANGGSRAYIMRVAPPDAKIAKSVPAEDQEGIIDFTAKNPGVWGNSVSVTFSDASKAKTQVFEDLGGGTYKAKNATGFNVGDVVAVDGAGSAEFNIITSVEGDNITFEAPFAADVVDKQLLPTVTIKTCEMNVEVRYDETLEAYEFVSLNVSSSNYIEKKLAKSAFVDVTAKANTLPIAPMDIVREVFDKEDEVVKISLKGGLNGTADALSDADYIGVDKGAGARTGIQSFLDNTDVSIMAVPGIVSANVQLSLVSHCENLGSRFAILDIPKDSKSVSDVMKHRDIVDSDYCAMYHPCALTAIGYSGVIWRYDSTLPGKDIFLTFISTFFCNLFPKDCFRCYWSLYIWTVSNYIDKTSILFYQFFKVINQFYIVFHSTNSFFRIESRPERTAFPDNILLKNIIQNTTDASYKSTQKCAYNCSGYSQNCSTNLCTGIYTIRNIIEGIIKAFLNLFVVILIVIIVFIVIGICIDSFHNSNTLLSRKRIHHVVQKL